MLSKINVAVLGSTGYVGFELVKILINHPNVIINYLGCENVSSKNNFGITSLIKKFKLPNLSLNNNFDPLTADLVFLALPHGISQFYVQKFFNKLKIIDLSGDFRLDSKKIFEDNYKIKHICSEYLNNFLYGLPEINKEHFIKKKYISIPGCYPTSILLPLIPLLQNKLINTKDIIIDSKSGYSGAGKKFKMENIKNSKDYNFYNYSTNNHRHICEIRQELNKHSQDEVNFSFNPHILPVYRGMMSTIYCTIKNNKNLFELKKILEDYYKNMLFVKILNDNDKADFFEIQNTNNCLIKLYKHSSENKVILVSLIDNLLKGASGQAIQCFNLIYGFNENLSLTNIK